MFEPPRNKHSLNVVARSFEINQSSRLGGARPCSSPLAAIWPVDFHDAFTQSGLHRVLQTKAQRLVSTERDGYFVLPKITKCSSINSAMRTNRTPVVLLEA